MNNFLSINNIKAIDALMVQHPDSTKECLRCAEKSLVGYIGAYLVNFVCDTCRMDNNTVEAASEKIEWTSEISSEEGDVK